MSEELGYTFRNRRYGDLSYSPVKKLIPRKTVESTGLCGPGLHNGLYTWDHDILALLKDQQLSYDKVYPR